MSRFTLQQVIDSTGASLVSGAAGPGLEGLSTDTRSLRQGEMFLALEGPNFDGNRYAAQAVAAGAAALLLGRAPAEPFERDLPVLVHPEPLRALADLASWYRSTLDCPVIGITGSCGKTTVKNITAALLERVCRVVYSPSSFNNEIGVPHTLLLARPDTEALVVEIGTNHPGEIGALCRIARPTVGALLNVGAVHLEGLGSLEGVAQEKGDLIESVPEDGVCVLNADCRFTPQIRARTGARVITFSVEGGPEARGDLDATDLYFHAGGTTFKLGDREVSSPLLGTHNVSNLLAALAICTGLGLDLDRVLPAVSELKGGPQRMEVLELAGVTVLDDSYNSNPEAARAAVRVLAGQHGHRRRVLCLGDMLELGELAAELHHRVGVEASESGIDVIVLVGELVKAAAAGALEAGHAKQAVVHFANTAEAAEGIIDVVEEGDVVLVKGSRGMRLEEVVGALRKARETR